MADTVAIKRIIRKCKNSDCNEVFSVTPCNVKKYCSFDCYSKDLTRRKLVGEKLRLFYSLSPEKKEEQRIIQKQVYIDNPEKRNEARERAKKQFSTQEGRDKTSKGSKKRYEDPAQRALNSELRKKDWQKPEYIEKQIKAHIGKKCSLETKKKMSLARLGKPLSVSCREKISDSNRGKKRSEETKLKLRISHLGKKPSNETRAKLKVARQKQVLPLVDTSIEIKIQDFLNNSKVQFEKHKNIFGQPDIFIEPNICIFCDGEYWHANPKKYKGEIIISKNRTANFVWKRDKEVNKRLTNAGYVVLRFWENDINKNFKIVENKILEIVGNQKANEEI